MSPSLLLFMLISIEAIFVQFYAHAWTARIVIVATTLASHHGPTGLYAHSQIYSVVHYTCAVGFCVTTDQHAETYRNHVYVYLYVILPVSLEMSSLEFFSQLYESQSGI